MDLLSELLNDVRIASSALGRFSLGAPFHLRVESLSTAGFVVLSGGLGWRRSGGSAQRLGPGDAVLGLRDTCYELASDFGVPQVSIAEAWQTAGLPVPATPAESGAPIRFRWGGTQARCELLAIAFSFDGGLRHPLFHALPADLVVPAVDERQSAAVQGALAFLHAESEVTQAGYTAMAAHLAETLFLGLLRSYALQGGDVGLGGLRALHDPRLHAAVGALHADPSRCWTVRELAALAAMSRSAFAQRFAAHMGMPPMAYVAALRMHLARRRLESDHVPIGLLAEQLGYRSERAFRKAFQRSAGSSPRDWRRGQR